MPIHFHDRDVVPDVAGLTSALIVPCYMCPAVTVSVRTRRPFIQLFSHLVTSAPFDDYIRDLQARLQEHGVKTDVFRSRPPHAWFMCMWTSGRRRRLRKCAQQYDAVVVLGCASATETVREAVKAFDCRVIEGMEVAGIMNARIRFHLPGNVSFDDCTTVSISQHGHEADASGAGPD